MEEGALELVSSTSLHSRQDDAAVQPIVEMWGISKRFRRQPEPILNGLDLTVDPGTLIWVGGRNGVGKTTLIRIAAGLLSPDDGAVSMNGLSPKRNRREYQRRIGFLSAGDRGLWARLSVIHHLEYWCALALVPRAKRDDVVSRALDCFDLGTLSRQRVDRLSMGQRQRVRLAMTFMHDPQVVLLDEPRNSLDGDGIGRLVLALEQLLEAGGAAIWCSPSGERADVEFDARYTLEDGSLTEVDL